MLTNENQKLVLDHLSFAEKIAKIQFRKTPPQVELDELKSAAYMGLVDAATRYDGKTPFESYARWRIIGEIKDYLRSLKWDRNTNTVASIPEGCDFAAEPEPESFEDVLDDLTKNRVSSLARNLMHMYYGQRLPMTEIARKVNLSGARISQLLTQNVNTLRESLCA